MEDLRRMGQELRFPAAASNLGTTISDDELLRPHAHSFTDVFGGPPRSIFSHQLSATGCFYDDIFWPPEKASAAALPLRRGGRNLPLFDIPSAKQISSDRCSCQRKGFFSDIFSWDAKKLMSSSSRSRSRSKTNSSSALSSEELSPLRPTISDGGHDEISLLASKLRPINVKKNQWDSSHENEQKWQHKNPKQLDSENEDLDKLWGCPFETNTMREYCSVELDQMNFRVSQNDDVQFNSPSSVVSDCEINDEMGSEVDVDEDDDDDDLRSSYVIELDFCNRETTSSSESNGVDEAIAWAKETFQKHSSQEKPTTAATAEVSDDNNLNSSYGLKDNSSTLVIIEDERSILDEKIKLWLTGKESDVRLLLSTLHHIVRPNSGWIAIPLMKLIESSQVKKAYQKSILCLHPDKLQQRGATLLDKYIAEKAFAALQDAWTVFVSLDVSYH